MEELSKIATACLAKLTVAPSFDLRNEPAPHYDRRRSDNGKQKKPNLFLVGRRIIYASAHE